MKRYQIKIDRCTGIEDVPIQHWKDLISSLVLCGYEVYGDTEQIVFNTGCDDIVKEIKE